MKRILHVLTDTNFGGAGMWLLNFLKSFDRDKYEVCVALPENAVLKDMVEELGIKVFEVKGVADASFSKKGIFEYRKLLKELRPGVVHTHSSLSARIAAKMCGIKTVNTRHCIEGKKKFPVSLLYRLVNNFLSSRVIGVSQAVSDNLIQDGIPKKKVRTIYNGIFPLKEIDASKKSELRRNCGFSDDDIVVGIVARMEPVKGHDVFIKAAALAAEKNEKLRFLIVGSGSCEEEIKSEAQRLGIGEKCFFAGYVRDVNDVNNIMDISVLTSKSEALSLSLIEAMSLGKPAVATDSGGTGEVIKDGVSGFVVENCNHNAVCEKILLLADDAELRCRMGKAGKVIVDEVFMASVMAEKTCAVYEEIMKK